MATQFNELNPRSIGDFSEEVIRQEIVRRGIGSVFEFSSSGFLFWNEYFGEPNTLQLGWDGNNLNVIAP